MRKHAREHGRRGFDLRRDVAVGKRRPKEAILRYYPEREAYECTECPGYVFYAGAEPGDAYTAALARDPALQPLLAGIGDIRERRELAAAIARGELGRELQDLLGKRRRLRTARAKRPEVEARRQSVQRYLLGRYEELGNVNDAIGSLLVLYERDRGAYERIVGSDRRFAFETFRDYWHQIPPQERAAARERYRAAKSKQRQKKFRR